MLIAIVVLNRLRLKQLCDFFSLRSISELNKNISATASSYKELVVAILNDIN